MFNAHADHITAPPHAALLAFSNAAAVHAFEIGVALGVQFHPEIDASFVATYVEAEGVEQYLTDNGWSGETLLTAARRHNEAHRAAGGRLFAAWLASVAEQAATAVAEQAATAVAEQAAAAD